MITIQSLLQYVIDKDGSDLHVVNNAYPMIRIDGALKPVPGSEVLNPNSIKDLVLPVMTKQQQELFMQNKELDFSVSFAEKARFRVNAYFQRDTMAAAYRLIPVKIRTLEELGLPEILYKLTTLKSGLVLVTGPTGHGKSSTLAAMIDEINKTRSENIITIEDPIEYIHQNKRSILSQRELNQDTLSWKLALRSILREDPNVVLVGEMRDYETISLVLTIAETGHLVFGTLHTNSAAQTIDRIVDVFPPEQQNQIRLQLANTLEAVISQRLLPAVGGGRVAVAEILTGTSAVKTNVREGKTHLIDNIIQTSQEVGMISLEKSMANTIANGRLDQEVAKAWCLKPEELNRHLGGGLDTD